MDFYYRKSMGNGAITSKFRVSSLVRPTYVQSKQSNLRSSVGETGREGAGEGVEETVQGAPVATEVQKNTSTSSETSSSDAETNAATATLEQDSETGTASSKTNTSTSNTPKLEDPASDPSPIENKHTHHPNNCNRCYRLKKKCSRQYPKCSTCNKTGSECEYIIRSNKRRKRGDREKGTEAERGIIKLGKMVNGSALEDSKTAARNAEKSANYSINNIEILNSELSSNANDFESQKVQAIPRKSGVRATEAANPSVEKGHSDVHSSLDPKHKVLDQPIRSEIETDYITPQVTSSHLSDDKEVIFVNGDKHSGAAISNRKRPRARRASEKSIPEQSLHRSIFSIAGFSNPVRKSAHSHQEELITMPAIQNADLPVTFISNYFENFACKYPFLSRTKILSAVDSVDFTKESIVNLDTYLVMSIGSLIYDKQSFGAIFSEKSIESVIDVLNLDMGLEVPHQEIVDNMSLLLLLNIYSIASLNARVAWDILSLLSKLVSQLKLYKSSDPEIERIVWSVHNLDSELSLLFNRPGSFPVAYNRCKLPSKQLYKEEDLKLVLLEIEYCQLSRRLVHLSLLDPDLDSPDSLKPQLQLLSEQLEKWRVASSASVHSGYVNSSLLSDSTSLINLNYYYLHVEIDQLSTSESLQFVFHFLSNSFSLLISETESHSEKDVLRISLQSSLTWFIKLNNVIRSALTSLSKLLSSRDASLEASLKLNEFGSNIQLTVNLLKYLKQHSNGSEYGVEPLHQLSVKLTGFNLLVSQAGERETLLNEVESVRNQFAKRIF